MVTFWQLHVYNIASNHYTQQYEISSFSVIPESIDGGFTRAEWQHHLRESLLFYWEPQFDPQKADDIYHAFDWFYTPWPVLEDEELNRAIFNDVS